MSFFVEYENVIMILGKDFGQDKGLFELFFKEHGEDIDQDLPKYEKYDRGRNILYVAVTRAIKNLRILYIDDLEEVRHNIEKIFGKAEAFPNQMTQVHIGYILGTPVLKLYKREIKTHQNDTVL